MRVDSSLGALTARAGKLAPSSQQFARLGFGEALDRYLADRAARVAPRSHRTESDHAKPLRKDFGTTSVGRISSEAVFDYIRQRKEKGISNVTINIEIGTLRRVLKRARRWHLVAEDCKPLPERHDVGRALRHEEKIKLLKVASSKSE